MPSLSKVKVTTGRSQKTPPVKPNERKIEMTTSLEVQLARIDERMKVIFENVAESRKASQDIYSRMDEIKDSLVVLTHRVNNVEKSLAEAAPTIEEFVTIKNKVLGAGMIGRSLWIVFGALIGMVFTARTEVNNWLSR